MEEYEIDTDSDRDSEEAQENLDEEAAQNAAQPFDADLVPEHTYLGRDLEIVHGRVLLDEGSIVNLPILIQPGFVGVPGQTLPLTTSHPRTVSMLKNVIEGNHTFGIVSFRHDENYMLLWNKVGTTAEIYEYGEPEPDSSLRVKAKVRQRFRLIETRRQVDGNIIGTVEILPESILAEPLDCCQFPSLNRHRVPPGVGSDLTFCGYEVRKRMYDKLFVSCTAWPSWVYKSYDLEFLSELVRSELRKSVFVNTPAGSVLPSNAVDLSYWAIKNLTLEDSQRVQLLGINNPNQRLRAVLSILRQCESLCCRECDHVCAKQSDVFAMSKEGPQGAYVNPFGVVHETLTVYKVDGIKTTTPPSTEFSWFPGYAWSICECKYCLNHMGWLFTATNRQLQPQRFWGLSRSSLKPKMRSDEEGKFTLVM